MLRATIRDEIDSRRVVPTRRVPERLTRAWTGTLILVDAIAVLAACYMVGLPPTAGPATCVLICGAAALCGTYQVSYAVRWYDEVYPVIVTSALVLVPLWWLLHSVTGLPGLQPLLVLLVSAVLMSLARSTLRLARFGSDDMPEATAVCISPEAQWRVRHGLYPVWKRTFDVVLSVAGLVLTSPLMLLAAVCIAIESGFPIFFRQERVGRDGSTFLMYKFRTMWQDAGTQWAEPGDSRITNVGAMLRRSSLDELPQLLNVLHGDMSLVGPRPEMPQFARGFRERIAQYHDRHIVRPGVTGWAQVYAKRNLRPDDMQQVITYDLFYIEHAAAALDAIIVAKTAAEFLFHHAV